MSLEADSLSAGGEGPAAPSDRRASSERRGKERRRGGTRINPSAPRRSVLRTISIPAIAITVVIAAIILIAGQFILPSMPWIPLGLSLVGVGFAVLSLILGCIEQRLIEIRLELMMMNGGSRQADRRQGDRRG